MLFYILYTLLVIPCMILFPTAVKGYRNLPRKGRMILVCNHQSNMDAILIGIRIPKRRFYFMAKAEVFKNKFLSWFFTSIGMYPVNREKNDIQAVKKTLSLLKKEKALCIFPEGTRHEAEEMQDAKNGVALFALKTKSPIVPSCFIKKPRLFRLNKLIVGEPFNLSEMDEFKDQPASKEILEKATAIITEKINGLKEEYLSKRNNKKTSK